jgi:hypothetical protein
MIAVPSVREAAILAEMVFGPERVYPLKQTKSGAFSP